MLNKIFDFLADAGETPWKSWIMHTVVALPIAAIGGPLMVLMVFGVRELEQVAWEWRLNTLYLTWQDSILDVAIPVVATWILL